MNFFHERLKLTMKQRGFSQQRLATMLGVTQQCVWEWCNKSYPSLERLCQLCDMLNTTPNYLLGMVD